ncbi:PREDICTED: uncharacterized protein LOC105360841 [Ceratosolen solmsi marchali]|uniref:Uncharacterized protein LOC105360841 n=1 Tax=Ceratosolen solmsi marchali TaxID=326594 RepID=A0AAJ7DTI7_9HYME|nr:PREDICTED: uncharacterized protein LOC105360841 [Ceratosolen solmsi marchali]
MAEIRSKTNTVQVHLLIDTDSELSFVIENLIRQRYIPIKRSILRIHRIGGAQNLAIASNARITHRQANFCAIQCLLCRSYFSPSLGPMLTWLIFALSAHLAETSKQHVPHQRTKQSQKHAALFEECKCNIENYEEEKSIIDENKILLVKNKKSKVHRENKNEQDGEEYEVEKIVDQRTIKGRRQFLVRWKGYTVESDTWEQEKELNCDRLIEEFLTEQEENTEYFEKDIKQIKKKIKKQDKKIKILGKNNKIKNDTSKIHTNEDIEDSKEYEVEKIIEVHFKKNKTREFLVRWKGFSPNEDTWEPEKHLNCPELINKFMEKLEKIKSVEARELRANPSHTKHFLLNVHRGKRQSRRNSNKQRVTYYEYD